MGGEGVKFWSLRSGSKILCSQEKGGPEESAYGRGLASAACRAAELTGSLRSLRGVRAGKLALVAVVDPGPQFE